MIKGHPLALASFPAWTRALVAYGGVDRKFLPVAARVSLLSLLTGPLRIKERVRIAAKLRHRTNDEPPLFIVGFWRSGTTFLHNLLTADPRFGYVTQFQAMAPDLFLTDTGRLEQALKRRLAETRPQDGVRLAIATPQEEEFPLSCVTSRSFYHGLLFFPKHLRACFQQAIEIERLSPKILQQWSKQYRQLLTKATINMEGRRLVLKNPPNLARIATLMDLFPESKFIHIYRNPYDVIPSFIHTLKALHSAFALQEVDTSILIEDVFFLYQNMYHRYSSQAASLPAHRLVEVRFEDLEHQPLNELKRIYETLGITDFSLAQPYFSEYLDKLRKYQKNVYQRNQELDAKIAKRCAAQIERWGFGTPAGSSDL